MTGINRPELRTELLRRVANDQELRHRLSQPTPDLRDRIQAADADNSEWLRSVLDETGWPGISSVGEDGAQAAWLIAQHAPDVEFQERCLRLVKSAVGAGEASPVHEAYLVDRTRMRRGEPQIFGTQGWRSSGSGPISPWMIEDIDRVHERRSAIGLPDLSTYFAQMNSNPASETDERSVPTA
jgi:uncharacterized protein DUF6624